ncbi:MAG: diaminopimelate epimerase [Litorivicinaceae bacterium]|jgi:diaminopimelate epimerase|nr:diaminopimelate epimerase [Litorivicinaceae bacterium]MDP5330349.1 diaminopimelate epimerase [Litorivicinaceae bacterium]MDP5342817.1 diaminopimelate epimerase [Litorivicinaceae bacterium]MDP5343524.1 diaminopimelate epimerase [Litorivicinaceae bacterium]MDP5363442.1 diaminopimelate epimerase [Litorivicinaceae bacterium]
MRIQFTKMHGLGNDFVVIDAISQHVSLRTTHIQRLSNRHTGIGFDQLLLIEPPSRPDADFNYRIFNADGHEVQHCGNGARCFARFVRDRDLTTKTTMTINTLGGLITLHALDDGQVRVDMSEPSFLAASLPYVAPPEITDGSVLLDTPEGPRAFGLVSMGNPHAVCQVEQVQDAPVHTIGPAVQALPQFPSSVNVGFMEVVGPDLIRLRVYERGVGETLACGTGACAAVAYGRHQGLLDQQVTVETEGGTLLIDWAGAGQSLFMTGPAESVYEGEFRL